MASVHADYVTVDELKDYYGIEIEGYDAQYARLIKAASRAIDRITNRRFYVPDDDETRYYDVPTSRFLDLGKYLWSLTEVVNGDGTTINSDELLLFPANEDAKDRIALKQTSSVVWQYDSDGNSEQVIAITGQWAYMDKPDAVIQQAVIQLVGHTVIRGKNQGIRTKRIGEYLVTFQKMQLPSDLPDDIQVLLSGYTSVVMA